MRIVMMTNTYKPILGGLEKSVEVFSEEYRKRGHKVLIVAPEFENTPKKEKDVFRLPAIKNIGDSEFSIEMGISLDLHKALKRFKPDIIHTHHPFLIGDTALRAAAKFNVPLVFTNHTLYEQNTHYLPGGNSAAMKKFVVRLAKGYADLCDQVIAPSESVANLLKKRGVKTPIEVLPTGIYIDQFKKGDGVTFRKFFDIPKDAFVVGIIGRMAQEKNVPFLLKAVTAFLKKNKNAYFVVVGGGPLLESIKSSFEKNKLGDRLICTGVLKGKQLISAYDALDVFAFSSHSETQGLVLVEAMASGTPVVGVDAPGVREVIEDKKNGRLLKNDNVQKFAEALSWIAKQSPQERAALNKNARKTAQEFSVPICVKKALKLYSSAIKRQRKQCDLDKSAWKRNVRLLKAQAELMVNTTKASVAAVSGIPKTTALKAVKMVKKGFKALIHS
ncbi:MAG: glycosyltransferase [Candidatus Omnitrophica bacterium]|nr:glycosyltransferase [Candidatus Omnitrophota bacterium]